ncbi:hypothetical protein OBBRIDRAFT_735836 [Obba rivulosa]|uniref:DUF6533 domain-containing protein n=1 Tax=Obba rivulosa TaxID=1052685 RepID=A0A8E2DJ86_9APHY|nr:hypothetical protein OBBRIDRAFT_735836 [Obba rivulosa]
MAGRLQTAVVLYDYLSTLSHEIELVWGRKITSITFQFYMSRWVIFIWAASTQALFCAALEILIKAISMLLSIVWAGFSAVRIYSIGGGSWPIAWIILLLNLVPVGTDSVSQSDLATSLIGTDSVIAIATRICVATADIAILLVTWAKMYAIKKDVDRSGIEVPVVKMLIRDGEEYLATISSCSLTSVSYRHPWLFVRTADLSIKFSP